MLAACNTAQQGCQPRQGTLVRRAGFIVISLHLHYSLLRCCAQRGFFACAIHTRVMDPVSIFSIVTGAAGLALQCGKVAKSLHDLSAKFIDARLTILSATQELDIIRLAWERIQELLQTWEDNDTMDPDLLARLNRQVDIGGLVMTALSEDLSSYDLTSDSLGQSAKVVWNESILQGYQDMMRGQATAMTLLLSVLQM